MATFLWRLFGNDTLAYLAEAVELGPLLSGDFELGSDEAFAILEGGGLLEVVTSASVKTGTGLGWVRKLHSKGADFRVLFVEAGSAEVVRHLWFKDSGGTELRGAIKLRFQINPARAREFAGLAGGTPVVTTSEVEGALGEELEAPLADAVLRSRAVDLRANPELLEEFRNLVTDRVKDFASRVGIKVTGLGLAWGLDADRIERMAAAAGRHRQNAAALTVLRASALEERAARLSSLKAAQEGEPHEASDAGEPAVSPAVAAPEERSEGEEDARFRRLSTFMESELHLGEDAGDYLSAPCGAGAEEGPFSSCAFQPGEPVESLDLPPLEEELTEPSAEPEPSFELDAARFEADEPQNDHQPTERGEGEHSEMELELSAIDAISDTEELTEPLEVVPRAEEHEPEESEGVEEAPSVAAREIAESFNDTPPVSIAEKIKAAPGWKTYGEETIACLVEEVEIPRLFRKDFALAEDEAIVVIRDGRCEDLIVRGIEKTSGALTWINRLHAGGRDLSVLYLRTGIFHFALELEGFDTTAEEIFGVLCVSAKVPPLSATGLLPLMRTRRSLGLLDLVGNMQEVVSEAFQEALVGENVSAGGYAAVEHILTRRLQKMLGGYGIEIVEQSFEWASDDEAFKRIEDGFRARNEHLWRFGILRAVLDMRRRIELAARRMENLAALLHLPENSKPDLKKMLVRSAYSAEALREPPKRPQELEAELRRLRTEIAGLTDELSMLVETGDSELRFGPPRHENRAAPSVLSREEEGFLADSLGEEELDAEITVAPREGHGASPSLSLQGMVSVGGVASGRNGAAHGEGENGGLRVGGLGAKLTVQTRCVHCMAPLRRDLGTCGNCGRKV